MRNFVVCVDFDDTLFSGSWDTVGTPVMPVILQTKKFCDHPNCSVILWTCREERLLADAIKRCEKFGIKFDAVNTDTFESLQWNMTNFGMLGRCGGRKVFADLYVDDKSPGSIVYFLSLDPEVAYQQVNGKKCQSNNGARKGVCGVK